MNNILAIGMTGEGKSPFIQKYIAGKRCFVFDVNNEYGIRTKYPGQVPINLSNNVRDARARQIDFNVKGFMENCLRKTNTICVFEEATAFFKGSMGDTVRRIMISKLFTGNVNIFAFHSIRAVPPDIMSYTNFVALFKTVDEPYQVKNKYPSLFPYYEQLKGQPTGSHLFIKTI